MRDRIIYKVHRKCEKKESKSYKYAWSEREVSQFTSESSQSDNLLLLISSDRRHFYEMRNIQLLLAANSIHTIN